MRTTRSVVVVLVAALLVLGAGALFGRGAEEPSAPAVEVAQPYGEAVGEWLSYVRDTYGGTTVTFAATRHPAIDAMQSMSDEFTRLTNIDVKFDIIEEGYLRNKLLIEAQGGTGAYDVLLIDAFSLSEYAPANVAADLAPFLENTALTPDWYNYEDIVPAYSRGIGTYEGTVYGIPVAGETRYVGYRKDLFEKYGKEPPETMADLLELARFFNGKEKDLYGIAMRAQKGIHFASGWMTTMYQNGGQFLDQQSWQPLVNTPETVASLEYYVDLLKQGPPDISVYTHEEAVSAFSLGRSAMWFDSTALTPWILDPQKSLVAEKVGFVPPPRGTAGAYGALAGWDVGLSPDTSIERQEAGWAFIIWMTSQLKAKDYVKLGGTPVRESVYSDPEMVSANWTFPTQLESLGRAANLVDDGILWLAPHPKFLKVIEVAGNYGSQVLAGQLEAKAALDRAQAEVENIMIE